MTVLALYDKVLKIGKYITIHTKNEQAQLPARLHIQYIIRFKLLVVLLKPPKSIMCQFAIAMKSGKNLKKLEQI